MKLIEKGASRTDIFEKLSPSKAVWTLAIPTIINQMITTIYNLADTFFVGRTGDPNMVAAVSLAGSSMMLINAFGNLFGMGGSSFISRCLGAKNYDKARRASVFCIYCSSVISIIMTILVLSFLDPFAVRIGASPATLQYTKDYAFWTMGVGAIPSIMHMVLGGQIRAEGNAKHEMIGMVSGHLINCVLDPIFIFPMGMGVAGAGLATMISNLIACIYYVYFIFSRRKVSVINFDPKNFGFDFKMIQDILFVGLPASLNSLINSVSRITLNNLLASYGDNTVAAMGVVRKLDELPMHVASGFTQSVMPLVGYNYAAKNYDRMEKCRKYALRLALSITLGIGVIYEIFAGPLVSAFISNEEVISLGAVFMRIHVLCLPFMIANFAIRSMFQALGKGPRALIVSVCRQGIIYVPLMLILNATVGLYGVVSAQIASDGLSLIVAYLLRRSIVKEIKAAEAEAGMTTT